MISGASAQASGVVPRLATPASRWLIPLAVWALTMAMVGAANWALLAAGNLTDTDSYTRLTRVGDLLQTGAWFSDAYPHTNAPFGDTLHWTRPLDVMILLAGMPFAMFVGVREALHLGGVILIPLTHLAAAYALMWAAAPLLRPATRILAAVLFIAHPVALSYASPGRVDHHVLLVLLCIATLGLAVRAMTEDGIDTRRWLAGGVIAGFGLWVSVEFMAATAVLGAVIWARGVADAASDRRRGLPFAGTLAMTVLIALFAERGVAGMFKIEYDRISIAHFAATLVALGVFGALAALAPKGRAKRATASAALGAVGAAALLALFPKFFAGPVADVDPVVGARFLDHVIEMQPLWHGAAGVAIWHRAAIAVAALPAIVGLLWILARPGASAKSAWGALAAYFSLYLGLTFLQWRWGIYLGAIAAVPFAVLLQRAIDAADAIWPGRLRLYATTLLPLAAIIVPFIAGAAASTKEHRSIAGASAACDSSPSLAALADRTRFPPGKIVLSEMGIAPKLIYRTEHRAIGSPYHRNAAGIRAMFALEDARDPSEARRILSERKVDYVLLCRRSITADSFAWVAAAPSWLIEERLVKGDDGGYRFFTLKVAP